MDNNLSKDIKSLSDQINKLAIVVKDIKPLSEQINKLAIVVKDVTRVAPAPGREALSAGNVTTGLYGNYYDVNHTITKATASDPGDFDSAAYDRERVYESLQRYSDAIQVINDGIDNLYVIVSHGGITNFTAEAIIRPGRTKTYWNIYELRLRSPTLGLPYTVTEYNVHVACCPTSGQIITPVSIEQLLPIEKALIQSQALPGIGINWLGANLVGTQNPTLFRVMVAVSITGVLSVTITQGVLAQTVTLNNGIALVANSLNMFNLLVHQNDVVNFSYSTTGGTIEILRVQEIDAGVT